MEEESDHEFVDDLQYVSIMLIQTLKAVMDHDVVYEQIRHLYVDEGVSIESLFESALLAVADFKAKRPAFGEILGM